MLLSEFRFSPAVERVSIVVFRSAPVYVSPSATRPPPPLAHSAALAFRSFRTLVAFKRLVDRRKTRTDQNETGNERIPKYDTTVGVWGGGFVVDVRSPVLFYARVLLNAVVLPRTRASVSRFKRNEARRLWRYRTAFMPRRVRVRRDRFRDWTVHRRITPLSAEPGMRKSITETNRTYRRSAGIST